MGFILKFTGVFFYGRFSLKTMQSNTPQIIDLKRLTSPYLLFWALILLTNFSMSENINAAEQPSTAFYYAKQLPLELLSTYQRVVVEPDNVTADELAYLKKRGVRVYAYFSIGEVGPDRQWLHEINPTWILGVNDGWKSTVMDMAQSGWHRYVIEKQLQALKKRGFDAFFLDTLDSYQLFAKTPDAQQMQQQGLVQLIRDIKLQLGDVHLLFNRGFEILDKVASLCDGVVAESLFKGWDPGKSAYKDVNEQDRTWLLDTLRSVKEKYNLPITVLDYLPPNQRKEAEKTAGQIKALGFIPWVSTPALDYMGIGVLNLIPRKVLLLYDSTENILALSGVHRFIAMPIEYLGYSPEYLDMRAPLPAFVLKGRYAGIVAWTTSNDIEQPQQYAAWILKQIKEDVKVVFMNSFPFTLDNNLKKMLDIEASAAMLQEPIALDIQSKQVGYEIAPLKRRLDLLKVVPHGERNTWLRVTGAASAISEPVFTAAWGGMALSPYNVVETEHNDDTGETLARWIINPFAFLKEALQLAELPIIDNTTENGRRILTAHIDGDGFYNKTELSKTQYSSELIMQDFIIASQLPHTVSIIEGEISLRGLQADLSAKLEKIARKMFSLPNVEIASHSFSHPFYWQKAADASKQPLMDNAKTYTLPIPGYRYNAEREIVGSADYINQHLSPPHKKAKVFLWSGDALPDEDAIVLAEKMYSSNINGGNTFTHNGILSLTNVAPTGIVQGTHFQPYAPVQNENRYTNDWLGPFYGYQEAINTFKLTDTPNRLKPISIYYHFYSGDKVSSVHALRRVYDWAQAQSTLPLWISEYTPRIYAFHQAVFEKRPQGWKIHHAQQLKTVRLASDAKPPVISAASGVAGYKRLPQGLYLSLTGKDQVILDFRDETPPFPYLDNSNAQIETWENEGGHRLHFRLKGHQAISLALAHFNEGCQLRDAHHALLRGALKNALRIFNFSSNDTGSLELTCE